MKELIFPNGKNCCRMAEAMDMNEFIETIQKKNLRNSVFVDVTANDAIAKSILNICKKVFQLLPVIKLPAPHLMNIIKN